MIGKAISLCAGNLRTAVSREQSSLCASNLLSAESRERCLANMKKLIVPTGWTSTTPSAPNASVLIPVCDMQDSVSLMYTIRSPNLRTHTGQISFPGGKMKEGESPEQAALRETKQEIGLCPSKIDVWGVGPPVPGRNQQILICPVIATVMDLRKQDLKVNTEEVSEVFAVPIDVLCNPANQFYTQFRNGYVLPVFVAEDYKIWGITAYLTHTFLNSLLGSDIYKNDWTNKKIDLRDHNNMQLEL